MYMNEKLIQEKLEEMNATKIQKLDSQMYLVNFDLKEDMRISYVFNITREGKYFLQRMRPYSMVHGKFSNEYEVLSFIKHDVEKFQNAANSTNFMKFLEISNKGLQLTEEIENAFMNYNVDGAILDEMNEKMEEVFDQIYLHSDISRRVLLHEDEHE